MHSCSACLIARGWGSSLAATAGYVTSTNMLIWHTPGYERLAKWRRLHKISSESASWSRNGFPHTYLTWQAMAEYPVSSSRPNTPSSIGTSIYSSLYKYTKLASYPVDSVVKAECRAHSGRLQSLDSWIGLVNSLKLILLLVELCENRSCSLLSISLCATIHCYCIHHEMAFFSHVHVDNLIQWRF